MTTVFIYGTLKRGGRYHSILAGQRFIGETQTTAGYTLYQPANYPGMIKTKDDKHSVTGELWSVSPECLQRLDQLEGLLEKLYERVPITLAPPHDALSAETYLYLRPLDDCPHLGTTWPPPV